MANYDFNSRVMEDVDIQIQHLLKGYELISVNKYCLSISPGGFFNSKVTGGCAEDYKDETIFDKKIDNLIQKYPGFVNFFLNKKGKKRTRISWKKISEFGKQNKLLNNI